MAEKIGSQSIGAKIRTLLVGVLIGFLVIGFAIWGINDVFSPQSSRAVASIGDTDILATDFERLFKRELENIAKENNGTGLSHQDAYQQGIHNKVLGGLIQQSVMNVDADDLGIGVNRRLARDEVSKIEVFVDELTGEFSETKYESILAMNRISREDFENDVYRDLRRAQTIPAIINGVQAPTEYALERYKFLTEQRKADVLTITRDAVASPEDPDEETLKEFIQSRATSFTAPEYRKFSLLRIENFDLTPDIEVNDESLREAFDYKVELGELGSPETRSIIQLIAPDQKTAEKARDLLNLGDDPNVISSGLGLIEPDIYTDALPDDIIDPETSKLAFDMVQNSVKVIQGSLGQWYAVKLVSITEAVQPDFESMREELEQTLLDEYAQEKLYDITGDIEDFMSDSMTFNEIAEQTDVTIQSFDYISRGGATQDGVKLTGIAHLIGVGDDDLILTEIFTNDIGYETDIFQTSTGGWAAIRVDDIIDSKMRPHEEVKDRATAMWKTIQIDESINDLMLDLASKAQQGEALADLAKDVTGAAVETVYLTRTSPSETVGPSVEVGLLEGRVGDIKRGKGSKPLTRQIAKLTDIIANNDMLAGKFADQLQQQATLAIRSDIQQAYQDAILNENTLQQNQEKIKSVLGVTDDL
ncbi:MAG: peptidylprolyl isomerase [Maricaulaceae bacterium]